MGVRRDIVENEQNLQVLGDNKNTSYDRVGKLKGRKNEFSYLYHAKSGAESTCTPGWIFFFAANACLACMETSS
jgi:hypothetical protein